MIREVSRGVDVFVRTTYVTSKFRVVLKIEETLFVSILRPKVVRKG